MLMYRRLFFREQTGSAPVSYTHLEQEGWDGHVGFVPSYLKEIGFDTNKTALVCGPPIMIKFGLAGLEELGFSREQVYTTLELRMKCGIGKCCLLYTS